MKELTKNQQKWLAKARDPSITKCRKTLKKNGSLCILGCAVAVVKPHFSMRDTAMGLLHHTYTEMGIEENTGCFDEPIKIDGEVYKGITDLNDNTDLTLPQLADIVERELIAGNLV